MPSQRNAVLARNSNISTGLPKSEDSWNKITQVSNYVNHIELGALNMDNRDVYSILTAVPSPWVRSYMMANSIRWRYVTRSIKDGEMKGMEGLYSAMQDEYKGLISCLALYGSRITVKKVYLTYSDESINPEMDTLIEILKKAYNIYEITGALGNMLFDIREGWNDNRKGAEEFNPPYFQLIYLDEIVIGATSPDCLLYPAAFYDLENSEIPFYRRGRFRDPIDHLDEKQLEKLYHYLGKLKLQIDNYENALDEKLPILLRVREFFDEFKEEIKRYIEINFVGFQIKPTSVLDYFNKFSYPFDLVFNMDMKIYRTKDGRYLNVKESEDLEEFNPDLLLLDAGTSYAALISGEMGFNPNLSTVLKGKGNDGNNYYFALPLSPLGLNEFYNELSDLLNPDRGENFLTADYNVDSGVLNVCLELTISNCKTPFYKRYHVINRQSPVNSNVIIWPNFVSPDWRSYYLYSDLVHNKKGLKILPLFAENGVTGVRKNQDGTIYHLTEDDNPDYKRDFKASLVVRYDENLLKERLLNYEIYQSEIPFTGIEIKTSREGLVDACCGFVLIKKVSSDSKDGIINYTGSRDDLKPVMVGIDFGSTNTSATYRDRNGKQNNIKLNNRRRFLLGKEDNDNNTFAVPNELFFFQNDPVERSIKSAMVYHDPIRLPNSQMDRTKPISGGIPVFERNLDIVSGSLNSLKINAIPNEVTELLYDLKWKREDRYLLSKKSFIKSIWILINAELFEQSSRPESLIWGFPSSMPMDLRKTYENIYEETLDHIKPIKLKTNSKINLAKLSDDPHLSFKALSESEALCNYALSSGGIGLGHSSVMVGIDIGGVTSDVMILATDPGDRRGVLLKQTSIKMAANKLSEAIGKSFHIQECIRHFVRRNKLHLPALEKINSGTATYLTNLLFEELEIDEVIERSFYSQLWSPENEQINRDHTRGLIGISSYICGLLLFHSGQLIKSVVEADKISENPRFTDIHDSFHLKVISFGKGGKMFEWLGNAINSFEAEKFYSDCFNHGFNLGNELLEDQTIKSISLILNRKNIKLEVGFGLTSHGDAIVFDEYANKEIIGENGYQFKSRGGDTSDLNVTSPVSSEHIFEFGENLILPEVNPINAITGLDRLDKFLKIYFELTKEWNLFDHSKIYRKSSNFAHQHLENYVKRDEDWQSAFAARKRSDDDTDFNFSSSPFLFQGMCFLDEVIIKNIYEE